MNILSSKSWLLIKVFSSEVILYFETSDCSFVWNGTGKFLISQQLFKIDSKSFVEDSVYKWASSV